MGMNNETSDILYATNSTNSSNSNVPLNCEVGKVGSCSTRDFLKAFIQKIETFKQWSAWLKVKELADKHNQPKSVIQIKIN